MPCSHLSYLMLSYLISFHFSRSEISLHYTILTPSALWSSKEAIIRLLVCAAVSLDSYSRCRTDTASVYSYIYSFIHSFICVSAVIHLRFAAHVALAINVTVRWTVLCHCRAFSYVRKEKTRLRELSCVWNSYVLDSRWWACPLSKNLSDLVAMLFSIHCDDFFLHTTYHNTMRSLSYSILLDGMLCWSTQFGIWTTNDMKWYGLDWYLVRHYESVQCCVLQELHHGSSHIHIILYSHQ